MAGRTRVLLKGELHSSDEDLREEKALLSDEVDVLVLEQSQSPAGSRFLAAWFALSIALLAWILSSIYHPMEGLLDIAEVRGVEVVYTRTDDLVPLRTASTTMKVVSGALFYTLVPGSLWIGFVTGSHLAGSMLLFFGLVLPVLVVRIYNTNRPDAPSNRDQRIADVVAGAGGPGDVVLAIVGVGHLHGVAERLPDSLDVQVYPPAHDVWSLAHVESVGLPTVKAGFVLFSLYVLAVWVVVHVVTSVSPYVVALLS